jgi:membrane-associated phospholipid phosphatase
MTAGTGRLGVALALACVATLLAATVLDMPALAYVPTMDPGLRALWRAVGALGSSGWMIAGAVLVAGAAQTVGHRSDQQMRQRLGRASIEALAVGATVAAVGLLAAVLKLTLGRPRPKNVGEDGAFAFDPFAFDYGFNSFPSGHATTAFAFAAAVSSFRPHWRATLLLVAACAATGRVFAGAHHPSDIVAGAALGWWGGRAACAEIFTRLRRRVVRAKRARAHSVDRQAARNAASA